MRDNAGSVSPASDKPWAATGISDEERVRRLCFGGFQEGYQPPPDWLETSPKMVVRPSSFVEALAAARRDALEDAAGRLEAMHFLFKLGTPGTGPFTRQDETMRQVVEQGAAAIRKLGEPT